MPRMLDVSDQVRAEIGDDEADRLIAGGTAPDAYDCTSCRAPGDALQEPTSTVLFVGEETAVLAFAHARCVASQVVPVDEGQLREAVAQVNRPADLAAVPTPVPQAVPSGGGAAVLGVTCGLVLCADARRGSVPRAALVVEPTAPVGRPGGPGYRDEFLDLLLEHGLHQVADVGNLPAPLPGWSVLLAMGRLHAVLQPAPQGGTVAWWQAHQPLQVTESWRAAALQQGEVVMFAAPAGSIGQQPREDLLRHALERAAANGLLAGALLPLAGA